MSRNDHGSIPTSEKKFLLFKKVWDFSIIENVMFRDNVIYKLYGLPNFTVVVLWRSLLLHLDRNKNITSKLVQELNISTIKEI